MSGHKGLIGMDVELAAQLLQEGKLVAIPTETVYGLAADATRTEAVLKIFEAKNRPFFDPLIVHVASVEAAQRLFALTTPSLALLKAASPGPLTLLVPKPEWIPDVVTAGLAQVAIRIPAHPIAQALLARLPFPLAAPSANPFGYISPTTASHVVAQLGDHVDYILDGGPATVGLESTIVRLDEQRMRGHILRNGGLPLEELQRLAPEFAWELPATGTIANTPGGELSHYAPTKPLFILNERATDVENAALLAWHTHSPLPYASQYVMAEGGDVRLGAANLFKYLRLLDDGPWDKIYVELAPEVGLGRAINDRLRRAAGKK